MKSTLIVAVLLLLGVCFSVNPNIEVHVASTNIYTHVISGGVSDGQTGSADITSYGPANMNFSGARAYYLPSGSASESSIPVDITPLSNQTVIWDQSSGDVDDRLSGVITLPFNVWAFERSNNVVRVTSNGIIYLNSNTIYSSSSGCCQGWPMSTQSTSSGNDYLVGGVWTDLYLYPSIPNSVAYGTVGSAPNRVFIVYFHNVSEIGHSTGGFEFQIKLFENGTTGQTAECLSNDDCEDFEFCSGGNCINVTGECGYAANHTWVPYGCCADTACEDFEFCSEEHNCTGVTGECGYAANHTWVPYECCADSDCGHSEFCANNTCTAKPASEGEAERLYVSLAPSCEVNVVTVVDKGGRPVEGAHVAVRYGSALIAAGDVDGQGQISFGGCGSIVDVTATARGFRREESSFSLTDCGQCLPLCTSDADCPTTRQCINGQCGDVPCECGEVRDHQCYEYECCSDADCQQGEACDSHACKQKQEEPECKSDADCEAGESCALVAGTAGGTCELVPCACGKVENHACVEYTCCADSDCAQGQTCVNHTCTTPAVAGSDVTCPTTGIAGDSKTCTVTEGGQPCAGCDYQITDPTGKTFNGKSDEDGNFELPLDMEGTYEVTLFQDGQPVKTIEVKSFPRAAPSEPEKPTAALDAGTTMLFLLLLLAVVVVAVLYWRGRGGRKAVPAGKK